MGLFYYAWLYLPRERLNLFSKMDRDHFAQDIEKTLLNRERLAANKNLLCWYKNLYDGQFKSIDNIESKRILEVGSGTSPLKIFYPTVLTSDIMNLGYLDYVLDAHQIDTFATIEDNSLDVITITNVLHHLADPVVFLQKAATKLKRGGSIIFTEPFISLLSKFIYVYLHHEPIDLHIMDPKIGKIEGPLSSANIALPFLIFQNGWDAPLRRIYQYPNRGCFYFSSISYMLTGGISKRLNIPKFLYKVIFHVDLALSRFFPKLFASFFTRQLIKK